MIKNKSIRLFGLFSLVLLFVACERDIEIDVPGGGKLPVVYGWIEPGQPPIIILTHSQPYFGTNNFSDLEALFIHNATLTVTVDGYSANLFELCTNNIPDSLMPVVSQILGIDSATLASINYCVYTSFDPNLYGVTGKTYLLNGQTPDNEILSSSTFLPPAVPLDSLWFKLADGLDSLGFVWARLSDPAATANAYRWFAMRKGKDNSFIAPLGSAFDDKFINGTSFDFGFNRGHDNFSGAEEEPGERGYFKIGDTIIVKFTSLDHPHFQFWRTFETQVLSNGNPFSAPAPIRGNVEGALGIWGAYGPFYDTVIAQ